jgi:hypothetical protein
MKKNMPLVATMVFILLSCSVVLGREGVLDGLGVPPDQQYADSTPSGQRGKIFPGTGIALTPRNFPRHTKDDVRQMFVTGRELGCYAVFIYQWSDPNLVKTAKQMMKSCRDYGYIPIIGLSPTILGGLRDQLDAPEAVRNKAGSRLSFANPDVRLPFIETALELAKLKPPYLCLATEINLMAFKNIEEYKYVAYVYKKLYPLIKKISPETKVFVSFQWDFFTILDNRDSGRISEHSKLIDIFRPELDLVAFTSYPEAHFSTPSQIPAGYYSRILRHVKSSDEIVFMEIGWPADNKTDEKRQQQFIRMLPALMGEIKPRIIAWSLLHDVKGSGLSGNLSTTGLLTNKGEIKAGFKAFEELRQMGKKRSLSLKM